MDEIHCFECNQHICWKIDCGPSGMHFCDSCKERQNEEAERDNENEEEDHES